MKRIIIFCALLLVLLPAAYCGQLNRIVLTDGSMVNGEIASYENGIYVIRTANFGEIKVESAKVFRIDPLTSQPLSNSIASAIQPGDPAIAARENFKQRLMNDPESAAIIATVAADPQIQAIASDPQIQSAAKSGDIQALMKNKKFTDMVNNPSVQDAVEKLRQQTNSTR